MDNQNPYGAGGGGGYGAQPAGAYPGGAGGAGRPMGGQLDVGDVFRTTFSTIRGAMVPVIGCALVVAVPTLITSFLIRVAMYLVILNGNGQPTIEDIQRMALIGSVAYLLVIGVLIVAQSIGQGGMMYAVAEHLSGRQPTLGTALRTGFSRLIPVVFASLLMGIILMIGLMLCVVPGLVAFVFLCMTVPVCVVERLGPIDSISRGVALTEGNRGPIALAFLALTVGIMVVSCCIMGPIAGIAGAIGGASAQLSGDPGSIAQLYNPFSPAQLLSFIAQMPVMIVQTMVTTTFLGVIYARLRGLRDGVDAQAIASVFT